MNKLPGVRVFRNNVGQLEWAPGKRLVYGLGVGSADLVGIVQMTLYLHPNSGGARVRTIGQVFALEVKRPGQKLRPDQEKWSRVVRSLGGFCCVVTSVAEAVAAVERCRAAASE